LRPSKDDPAAWACEGSAASNCSRTSMPCILNTVVTFRSAPARLASPTGWGTARRCVNFDFARASVTRCPHGRFSGSAGRWAPPRSLK
jgi:hypothetical protein